jgi:hypothetical protein
MATRAQAQEAMKLRELMGEGKTNGDAGAASSSSVTSEALHLLMVLCLPAMPRAATPFPPQAHMPPWLGGA